jgi:Uma2 family endonuclease
MSRPTTTPVIPPQPTLPLEPGDHLTREEFERRYDAMPHLIKAELIEGVVYIPSSVQLRQQCSPRMHLAGWLGNYRAYTPGVDAGYNATVRLDATNELQPDVLMIIDPSLGGQAVISADDYIEGAPELIAQVAASSASLDLHTKLRVYRRNQVREYLVWRVLDAAIDWFVLRQSQYERLPLSPAGFYQSEVFPGLWLDPAALAGSDLATVLQVLQQGISSPEHTAFVARLRQAAATNPGLVQEGQFLGGTP